MYSRGQKSETTRHHFHCELILKVSLINDNTSIKVLFVRKVYFRISFPTCRMLTLWHCWSKLGMRLITQLSLQIGPSTMWVDGLSLNFKTPLHSVCPPFSLMTARTRAGMVPHALLWNLLTHDLILIFWTLREPLFASNYNLTSKTFVYYLNPFSDYFQVCGWRVSVRSPISGTLCVCKKSTNVLNKRMEICWRNRWRSHDSLKSNTGSQTHGHSRSQLKADVFLV